MDLQSLPWYGQLLVFFIIGGIAVGIFYMLHYSDVEKQIEKVVKQISDLEEEIKRAEKKEAQLPQIREAKAGKEKVLESLKEILPEQKEISQIINRVQGIILAARLKMYKWTTLNDKRMQVYTEVPIAISLDGNYHNLGIFFDQLSKMKKIFTIDNLSIKPLAKMSTVYSIKASFTASTYTYRENVPGKKGDKKTQKRARRPRGGDDNEEKF